MDEFDNEKQNTQSAGYEDDFSVIEKRYTPKPKVSEHKTPPPVPPKKQPVKPNAKAGGVLKRTGIIAASIVIFAATAFTIYAFTLPTDKIAYGMRVGGVAVGGLTAEEAAEKLEASRISDKHEIIISAGGTDYTLLPTDIDTQVNIPETANRAFSVAKSGNRFANAVLSVRLLTSGGEVPPVVTYDEEKLTAKVNEIGISTLGSVLSEHSVRFADNGKAYIVPGKSGYDNNPQPVMEKIKTVLEGTSAEKITVEFAEAHPTPMTIEALDAVMYANPTNAAYVLENGSVTVTDEKTGRYIDKQECAGLLSSVTEGGAEIEVPYKKSEPEVTAAVLRTKLFNEKLSTYTTRYNAGQTNRSANIANAAARINGTIIMPGETLSFNKVVGKRTVANGFKSAPEYQNGQTVVGIGGGTCQVSTTVYSAALYADLKIVKRSNHSMSVSYVPLGQDATVTDGGTDLQIMNDTGYPIKFSATTGRGSVTVTVTGTTPDSAKTVKILHSNVAASSGTAVKTERIVYDASGKVIKQEAMGTSRYKPHSTSVSASEAAEEAPSEVPSSAPAFAPEAPPVDISSDTAAETAPAAEENAAPTKTEAPAQATQAPPAQPETKVPPKADSTTPEKTE